MEIWAIETNFSDIPTAIIKYRRQYLIIKPVFVVQSNFRKHVRRELLHKCDDVKNPEISKMMEIEGALLNNLGATLSNYRI